MNGQVVSNETSGSGLKQWGADWFFKKDGRKTLLNGTAVKWAGGIGVLLFAILQFSDSSASPMSGGAKPDAIAVPGTADVAAGVQFPENVEKPFVEAAQTKRAASTSVRTTKLAGPQLIARPRTLVAIPPGSLVRAVLVTGASNGLVKATLEDALVVNGEVVLEGGATLLGQGSSTEERLFVAFDQVVFRDGTFGKVQAQACDLSDQIVGLKGSRVGTKVMNLAGSVGLGFVGGLTEGLQDTQGQQGVMVRAPSVRNALLHATATTAIEQSRNLMSDLKERKPIIEVASGTPICILFSGVQ